MEDHVKKFKWANFYKKYQKKDANEPKNTVDTAPKNSNLDTRETHTEKQDIEHRIDNLKEKI